MQPDLDQPPQLQRDVAPPTYPPGPVLARVTLAMVCAGFALMVFLYLLEDRDLGSWVPWFAVALTVAVLAQAVAIPWSLSRSKRRRTATFACVVPLVLVPTVWAGAAWLGTWGFLGASALLALPRRVGVAVACVLVAGAAGVQYVEGVGIAISVYSGLGVAGASVAIFGLTLMGLLTGDLRDTRLVLAATSVVIERQRFQRRLEVTLTRTLEQIQDRGRRAKLDLLSAPENSQTEMRAAASATHDALRDVRAVAKTYPGSATAAAAETVDRARKVRTRFGVTTSLLVLCGVLSLRASDALVGAALTPPANSLWIRVVLVVAVLAIQLGFFVAAPPRVKRSVLYTAWAFQGIFVTLLIVLTPPQVPVPSMVGFFAGTALLLLPRWQGVIVAAAAISASGLWATGSTSAPDQVYPFVSTLNTALFVYGLTVLHQLSTQLNEARQALAERAVAEERTRLAADLHDFLGLTLSAIALKSHLVVKLAVKDSTAAHRELTELMQVADRAHREIMWVSSSKSDTSLSDEITAALVNLSAADVDTTVKRRGNQPPPAHVYALVTTLREGVTNALRHSDPSWCRIKLTTVDNQSCLSIRNDGARRPNVEHQPGTGLKNIHGRVESIGGNVSTTLAGDEFVLEVTLPAPPMPEPRV